MLAPVAMGVLILDGSSEVKIVAEEGLMMYLVYGDNLSSLSVPE